jgi:hypothetical protein
VRWSKRCHASSQIERSLCSRVWSVCIQPDSLANALSHARSHTRSHTIAHTKVRRSKRCHASSQIERSLCLRVWCVCMQPDFGSDTLADAVADAIADAIADTIADYTWIQSTLKLRGRILQNPCSVLQWHPAVCAVRCWGLVLSKRLDHAVWPAVREHDGRERLPCRLRMPTWFAGGECEYGGVRPRLLLSSRKH